MSKFDRPTGRWRVWTSQQHRPRSRGIPWPLKIGAAPLPAVVGVAAAGTGAQFPARQARDRGAIWILRPHHVTASHVAEMANTSEGQDVVLRSSDPALHGAVVGANWAFEDANSPTTRLHATGVGRGTRDGRRRRRRDRAATGSTR